MKDPISKKSRSILDEINRYVPPANRVHVIESRGESVVATVMNFFQLLESTYPEDQATELKNRLLSSFRGGDPGRFTRALRKLEDNND